MLEGIETAESYENTFFFNLTLSEYYMSQYNLGKASEHLEVAEDVAQKIKNRKLRKNYLYARGVIRNIFKLMSDLQSENLQGV